MNRRSLVLAGVGLVVLALLVTLPLRLILPGGLFTARAVTGSIWSGQLDDVRLGGLPLGSLRAGYRPLARLLISSESGLTAELGWGGNVSKLNGTIVASGALAPFPVEAIEFKQVSLDADDAGCKKAEGRIRLTLASSGSGLPPGTILMGPLRCEAGDLAVRLASQSGLDTLDLRLRADRQFQATMTVRPASPEAAGQLQALGFRQSPTGYQLPVSRRY
jgi:general secretion pathway protein N